VRNVVTLKNNMFGNTCNALDWEQTL